MLDLSDFGREDGEERGEVAQVYETNKHKVGEEVKRNPPAHKEQYLSSFTEILIREYAFSATNSGSVWKSTFPLCEYVNNNTKFRGKRILELGSGTGIASIYLRKMGFDVTSSDIADEETTQNIKHNCEINNVEDHHIPHDFPEELNNFDIVIASDIILYENYYTQLLRTLKRVLSTKEDSFFVMTYKRKAYGEKRFFVMLEENGFTHQMIASKMWEIELKENKPIS